MEHKHSVSQPQMPLMDHDRMWSHPLHAHWVNLGPGCVMFPSEEFSAYGPNSLGYTNFASTTNFPAMPNLNLVIPTYVRANAGMSQERYMHYKRNVLTLQNLRESTSTNAFYDAPSFFNHPFSTGILDSRNNLGLRYYPWNPNSMISGHRSNITLSSEEGQRKVRGQNTSVIHPGSISSDHLHSRATTSVLNVPRQRGAPLSLNSHTNHIHSSDFGSFNHQTNQFHGACHIDGSGNFCLPGQPTPDWVVDHNIWEQRTNDWPNMTQTLDFGGNMVDIRLPALETDVLQSPSRELSIVRHVDERNGRVVAVMDQSTMYDSWNLFDENQDMRLDIDNMSYEELLALEEQIGVVNTGLSESTIAEYLLVTIYSSDTIDSQEEVPCSICLVMFSSSTSQIRIHLWAVLKESYNDVDCVGRLHCGHDFHFSCIKKWLLMKNVCPICKASAAGNILVEQ